MWFQLKSYFLFFIKSTNKHGVHSPFVYHLITKCFNSKIEKERLSLFLLYKKHLLKETKEIVVTDFGAGSKIFKSNKRAIAKIAKVAGISTKKATLLIKIVHYFLPNKMLEIGTSLGLSTKTLFLGNPKAHIISLEGCPETAAVAKKQLSRFQCENIDIKIGNFKETLPKVTKNNTFDFIYFDGNHQKAPTLQYFLTCLQTAHNDTVFIFDDIHWSKEMEEAWREIKNHPKVTVTIDVFYFGLVFFRKEQEKEHFMIRA